MTELSPLRGIDWIVVFALLFALAVVAMSLRRDVSGRRVGGLLVIPLISGVLLLAGIGLGLSDNVADIVRSLGRPLTAVLVLFMAVVAVAVADLLFTRFATVLSAKLWSRRLPTMWGDVGLAVFVGGAALVALVAVLLLEAAVDGEPVAEPASEPAVQALGATWDVETVTDVPGQPLGITVRSERDGYLSVGGDRVMHFELGSSGEPMELTTVAEGFTYARGLTVAGDILVVADLGPLPVCPEPFPYCKGLSVPDVDPVDGEQRILEESDGRLIAYDIEADGTLTDERVIVDGLPVANTEHGVNGVVTGPDGSVYSAIGNIDLLPPDRLDDVEHRRRGLLGTVIRVTPDGEELEVLARGLRNVYGLAFDEDGGLWGVDNDGTASSGWRAEEILNIRNGRDYGFPDDGSFGPGTVRDDWPIWHADGVGAAGVTWAGDLGLGPGLVIGLCGHIDGVRLTEHEGEWQVEGSMNYAQLLDVPGCVSDLAPVGDGRFLAAVFDAEALHLVGATAVESE